MLLTKKETELLELLKKGNYTFNELLYMLPGRRDYLNKYLNHLKLAGYDVFKRYYADGRTKLFLPTSQEQVEKNSGYETLPLVTFLPQTSIKILIISDMHIGGHLQKIKLLDKAYEYAIKHNIHTIFCCGDILEGDYADNCSRRKPIQEQIESFIKSYPYDKNILTFGVLGDHEEKTYMETGVNIREAINTSRNDIVIGKSELKLMLRNEFISLKHIRKEVDVFNGKIVIFGHSHLTSSSFITTPGKPRDKHLIVKAPALSNASCGGGPFPSMIEMDLTFDKMYISLAILTDLYYSNIINDFEILDEQCFKFPKLDTENVTMRNVEYYSPEKTTRDKAKIKK